MRTNFYYAFNSDTPGTYRFGCVVTNACCMVTNATVVYVLPATTAPPPVINCTDGACVLTWTGGERAFGSHECVGTMDNEHAHVALYVFTDGRREVLSDLLSLIKRLTGENIRLGPGGRNKLRPGFAPRPV